MSDRMLYLASYDVSDRRRLAAVLHIVRGYSTGGQKSVHEVFLTEREKFELLHELELVLEEDEDRFFLLRLDPRSRTFTVGAAMQPSDPRFFLVS